MQLSIAFISHNRKNELLCAIESCFDNLPENTEFIILDNASDDGTQEHINMHIKNKCKLIYEYSSHNLGVAGGRNRAFELSSGKYVFFLDDDAKIMTNNFFDKIITYMDTNPSVAAASVDIQEPELGSNLNCKYRNNSENGIINILSYCGCAHILRASFYKKFKELYPSKLMFGSEELYASFLAWMNGMQIVEFSDLLVGHYPSTINRCAGKERMFNFIFNQYIIKTMTYPRCVLPLTVAVFKLHMLKNKLIGKKWNERYNHCLKERYSKDAICRMNIKCWAKLVKLFGWKVMF